MEGGGGWAYKTLNDSTFLLLIKTSIFHLESLWNKDTSAPYEDQFCREKDHQYEGIVSTTQTGGNFLFSIRAAVSFFIQNCR